MNQKTVFLVVISSIFLLGAGVLIFSPGPKTKNDLLCDLSLEKSSHPKSDKISISVHVDGSGSMLGYVTNSNSRYVKALDLLYDTFSLVKSRPQTTVKYFRSGNNNQKLTISEFKKAQQTEFYDGRNSTNFPPVSSGLDSAIIPPEKEDKLFVLVTDLYQNEADVTSLNKKIQETYLNKERKGYAVGILAFKSEFNGKVYVLGNNQEQFIYDTQGKPLERFRPFYILIMGPYDDIVYYIDKLKNNGKDIFDETKSVIFSPTNLVSNLSSLATSKLELTREVKESLRQTKSLNDGKVAVQIKDNSPIKLWNITSNSSQTLSIPYSVDFVPLNDSLPIDDKTIQTHVKVESLNQKQTSDEAKSLLQLDDWKVDNKKLNFTANINPKSVQKPGIYYFTVDALAKDLQEQEWWDKWSWTAGRDAQNDGSKTHNLSNFLRGLKTLTTEIMETEQPIIGRFCYTIQKN
ncbi:hypothetical protein [Nostoc sp. CCY 9925]|uniref:hypothetical protein n=1 Tax=Nostoc sp. CCY 9925 TaxID=3103865 RepID=UPI0039C67A99